MVQGRGQVNGKAKGESVSDFEMGSAGLVCKNYCVKCADGSTVWFDRRKSLTRSLALPVAVGYAFADPFFGVPAGLGTAAATQACTKTSIRLNKFRKANKCVTRKLLRKGSFLWRWKEDKLDPAGKIYKKEGQEYEKMIKNRSSPAGEDPSKFQLNDTLDEDIYWQGCAVVMGRAWSSGFKQAFSWLKYDSALATAVKLCASHSRLCGKSAVVGFARNAHSKKQQCLAACEKGAKQVLLTSPRMKQHETARSQFTGAPVNLRITPEQARQIHVAPLLAVKGGEKNIFDEGSFGAVVTQAPKELQEQGLMVENSLVSKVNRIDSLNADFNLVEFWLQDAKKTVKLQILQHSTCPNHVIQDIEANKLFIWRKSKSGAHAYVKCITTNGSEESRKISCRPQECGGDAWCFVPDGCKSCRKKPERLITCEKPAGDRVLQAAPGPATPELWQVNVRDSDLSVKSWKLDSERIPRLGSEWAVSQGGRRFLAVQEGDWLKLVDPPGYIKMSSALLDFPLVVKSPQTLENITERVLPVNVRSHGNHAPRSWTLVTITFESSILLSVGMNLGFDGKTGMITRVGEGKAKDSHVEIGWQFHTIESDRFNATFGKKVKEYANAQPQVEVTFRRPVPAWKLEVKDFLETGELGLSIDPENGVVRKTVEGEQGDKLGVENGWMVSKVCQERFDAVTFKEVFQQCRSITFLRPVYLSEKRVTIEFDEAHKACFEFDPRSGIVMDVPKDCKDGVSAGWVAERINDEKCGEGPMELPEVNKFNIAFRVP